MVPEDSWQYSVTGTIDVGSGSANFNGTASAEILSIHVTSPVASDNCLDQYSLMSLNVPGVGLMSIGSHVYFLQDFNGSIREYGEGAIGFGTIWVVSPTTGYYLNLQSPMTSGAGGGVMSTMWYVPGPGMVKEDAYVPSWEGTGMAGYVQYHYTVKLSGSSVSY